ncbi:MAG: RagB/SusD family nutrient uptake outer membrane protein [Bacteroidota bacterium]
MKKCFTLLILVFTVCCSSDSDSEMVDLPPPGNLQVLVQTLDERPLEGASVSTIPATTVVTTGADGIALFNNIESGSYLINVDLPTDAFIYTSIPISVTAGETASFSLAVGPQLIIESPIDIDILLEACYSRLKRRNIFDALGYVLSWGDIGSDILYNGSNASLPELELDRYNFSSSNTIINNVWEEYYGIIILVNQGLDAINLNQFTSENPIDQNKIKAEFQFLRALLYFNLVKLYGNPVVVTTALFDLNNPPPFVQGQEEAYALIVSDLIAAQTGLGASTNNTRATLAASQALLGKVYLQMAGFPLQRPENYALALTEFEKLVGNFSLETNYEDVFSIENEDSTNEIIFKIPFDSDGNYGALWGPIGLIPQDSYEMAIGFPESFFEDPSSIMSPVSFPLEVQDSRFYQNLAPFSVEKQTPVNQLNIVDWRPYKFKKALEETVSFGSESFDFPYLRYADVLLMIAEAENAINGPTAKAYTAINEVRRRAFGNADNDLSPGLSQQDFLQAVLEERRRELCFEGHRKDDLIRNQSLESVIADFNLNHPRFAKNFESFMHIWPIPQIEIITNPLVQQNPGYQ